MKKMNQTELLRYIAETVLTYEKLEVTSCILWDYMCYCSKILDWFIIGSNTEPLYIAISKIGVGAGSKEYVTERCNVLGKAIHLFEIKRTDKLMCDFEVKEY